MTTASQIGQALRTARRHAGLTQQQLAELAETSPRTVQDIEKGTGSSSLAVVIRALNVLGLSLQATE